MPIPRLCESCQQPFSPTRSWQLFCSKPCKHKVQGRRHYLKHQVKILRRHKKWTAAHPEYGRESMRAWRAKHPKRNQELKRKYAAANREKLREQARIWRATHPEKVQQAMRKWALAHPDKVRENVQRWARTHPEMIVHYAQCRRSRKAAAPVNDLTHEQWLEIQAAFHFRCAYCPPDCNACQARTHRLTQDHVSPLGPEGSHTLWNIVPACISCNSKKRRKAPPVPVQPLLLTIAPPRKPRT